MYKNARMLTGSSDILQERYIKGGTKKIRDDNAVDNDAYAAPTKPKLPKLKKQRTKKHSDNGFIKITLTPPKPKHYGLYTRIVIILAIYRKHGKTI